MDFDLLNQYARQILEEKDDRHQELVNKCLPYLYSLRKKLGFHRISQGEIRDELAADAVSDAVMAQQSRGLRFSVCLHNSFRDLCRQRCRIIREHDTTNIVSQCEVEEREKLRSGTRFPPPPIAAQDSELIERANSILENHDLFSKKVVLQKTRGATYPDMADIFSTPLNECKRVYWHDINHIREKLNPNPGEERI